VRATILSKPSSLLIFVVGAVAVQVVVFGHYLDYVKPTQGPLLLAAGGMLIVVGLIGIARDLRHPDPDLEQTALRRPILHTHGPLAADPETLARVREEDRERRRHDHARAPAIAWLWVLPVSLVLAVPPPALGAFAASRAGAPVPQPVAHRVYGPLPPGAPLALAVHDYAERAAWDHGHTLTGRTVMLTGFATPKDDGGWYLARIVITCCAADSRSYLVEVAGSGRAPAANSWQQVTGVYAPSPAADPGRPTARITATAPVIAVSAPANTYELP
jgi:uncharacterized repeat protein (TIGR03943 family)